MGRRGKNSYKPNFRNGAFQYQEFGNDYTAAKSVVDELVRRNCHGTRIVVSQAYVLTRPDGTCKVSSYEFT